MLKASGLSKKINNTFLFEKIDFEVNPKDLIFIQGRSGSGKSIFLKCLTLLTPTDEGKITFNDLEITDVLSFRSQIHYLRQDFSPILPIVGDIYNEAFNLRIYKERKTLEPIRFLEEFGLDIGFLKKKAPLLSGGEKQIVHLTRSLCLSPKILLLDEPTSAMDHQTKKVAERLISSFVESGGAVVWITHENPPLLGKIFQFPKMEKQ